MYTRNTKNTRNIKPTIEPLKQKTIKVGNQKVKIILYDKDCRWIYEVVTTTMFCNITWDKSLNAMKNWMNR